MSELLLIGKNAKEASYDLGVLSTKEKDNALLLMAEELVRSKSELSAIVSLLINADLLIILSDIDGFYDSDPRGNENAKLLDEIEEITEELEVCAGGAGTNLGTGGMATKLIAAKRATKQGIDMVLANGSNPEVILDILEGKEIGTLFVGKR